MHRPAFALIPRWLCLDLNKYSGEEQEFSATAQLGPFHLPWPQLFIYLRGIFLFCLLSISSATQSIFTHSGYASSEKNI
jgi:hypothetical protein